jgi:hypothetical protein
VGLSEIESPRSKGFDHSVELEPPKRQFDIGAEQYAVAHGVLSAIVIAATVAIAELYGPFRSSGSLLWLGAVSVVPGVIGSFFGATVGLRITETMKPTFALAIGRGLVVAAISFSIAASPFVLLAGIGALFAFSFGLQMFGTQGFVASVLWSVVHWILSTKIARLEPRSITPLSRKIWFWFWLAAGVAMLVVALNATMFFVGGRL